MKTRLLKSYFIILSILGLFIILSNCKKDEEPDPGHIKVSVFTYDDQILEGFTVQVFIGNASVELKNESKTVLQTETTDDDGYAVFSKIKEGTYFVGSKFNYGDGTREGEKQVIVTPGDTTRVDLECE